MNQQHAIPSRARLSPEALHTVQQRRTADDPRLPGARPDPRAAQRTRTTAAAIPEADVLAEEEEYPDDAQVHRRGRSALRYERAQPQPVRHLPAALPTARKARKGRIHPLCYVGLGMALAAAIGAGIVAGGNWGQQQLNTWTYGYPRTYQTDAVVGHNDGPGHPSHFLAENLHGQIVVIEFPGSDPSRGRDLLVTTLAGPGNDQVPVTLSFLDANGDGRLDLVVHVGDQLIVLLNDQGTFRPLKPGEQVQHVHG